MARSQRVALEAVEHLLLDLVRDTAALIGDGDADLAAEAAGTDPNGLAGLREADGVGQQVEQDLAQALGIGAQRSGLGGDVDLQPELAVGQAVLQPGRRLGDALGDVDLLDIEGEGAIVDRGEVEDVVDDGEQRAEERTMWPV